MIYRRKGILKVQKALWHGLPPAIKRSLDNIITIKNYLALGDILYLSAEAPFLDTVPEGGLVPIWLLSYNPFNREITWQRTPETLPDEVRYSGISPENPVVFTKLGEIWTIMENK